MYLLYLDDSGSEKNRSESHIVLAGIVLHEDKLFYINKRLDEIASRISPTSPNQVEFHASAIYAGKEEPWSRMTKKERCDIIKEVLEVIKLESRNLAVFACAIHKPSYPVSDTLELAFEDICSRFNLFINRMSRENGTRNRGLIILDESSHETSLQKLSIDFRNVGTRWGITTNLQEVPLFVDSKASRAIQLADHVAYAIFRYYEAGDLNYLKIIQAYFDADDERLHGLSHKQTQIHGCTCPACILKRFLPRHGSAE